MVHPGIEIGVSCVDSAKSLSPVTELGPSEISCDGSGVCTELRPCQLRCDELPRAMRVAPAKSESEIPAEIDADIKCDGGFWSACDFKCNQTKVESVLYTDGECHERRRQSRICHKDACGRSDPCRIPFIVHSIYNFRGVDVSEWTSREDDVLAEALTHTFHTLSLSDDILFRVGDVKTLLTRPWALDDDIEIVSSLDNEDLEQEEIGVKVVVQISIFNPDIQLSKAGIASKNNTSSSLSQLVKNFTETLRNDQGATTVCRDSDLYALAKNARLIAYELPELPGFMQQLISNMMSHDVEQGERRPSAFVPLYSKHDFAQQSRLESSWTIRTDVDDEINYFGPPEPLFFAILR